MTNNMIMSEKRKHEYPFYIPIHIPEICENQLEGNKSIHNIEEEWIYANYVITVNQISQDEAPLISLPFNIKIILSILMILSLLIGSYFKLIMYGYVFTANKQNRGWMHRPINVLTVTSAIIHHTTHVALGIWNVVIMMLDTPLGDIVGFRCCQLMMMVGEYGIVYLSVGSLGVAVYRVLYIRHEYWVKYVCGEKLLLFVVVVINITMTGLLVALHVIEDSSHRAGVNMCTGISVTQGQIMIDYNLSRGIQMLTTTYLQITAVSITLACQSIEFSIYIWFFCHRYQNDNGNIRHLLEPQNIRNRNRKNAVTFLGQFYGFVIEYAFLLSFLLLHLFASEHAQHFRVLVVLVKLMDFGLLSAVEVLTSPGLKGFMR